MIDQPIQRKPKFHFDTAERPASIVFEEPNEIQTAIPWSHFEKSHFNPEDPALIRMEIGPYAVLIHGQNLKPLHQALGQQTVSFLKVQPSLTQERERGCDTFVTEVYFSPLKKSKRSGKREDSIAAK